jgi:hypothetical protein
MYYSYVEIEYVATSFSPARMDLALKLKAHSEGTTAYLLNEPWTWRGRPKIWCKADIEAYGMKVKSMQNVKHTIKDLNDALVKTMIQKGCQSPHVPESLTTR